MTEKKETKNIYLVKRTFGNSKHSLFIGDKIELTEKEVKEINSEKNRGVSKDKDGEKKLGKKFVEKI